jgi:hypothetical protein
VASADTAASLIVDLTHSPLIPGPDEEVIVSATVLTASGDEPTVTLFYRLDRSEYNDAGWREPFDVQTYQQVPMSRDPWGDHVYTGRIAPQNDGEIVEFYVQAEDEQGVRAYPPPSRVDGRWEQITNALYCVDSAIDVQTYWVPGGQPLYYVIMTGAEETELSLIGDGSYSGPLFASEAMSNAHMNATFISVDGTGTQVRYRAGVRNRGNRSRVNPPLSVCLDLAHDRPWKGVTSMNLNSKYPVSQLMGSLLFQMADLPVAEARAVQFRINGVNLADADAHTYGSYVALEDFDSDWAQNHYPHDAAGNLYRCTYYSPDTDAHRQFADLTPRESAGQVPDPNDYRDYYPKMTNAQQEDWTDLFDLIDRLNEPSLADDMDTLGYTAEILDMNEWTRFMATNAMAGNREGSLITGHGDDYAMYRGVEDPRFQLVPHDLDTVLGENGYDPRYPLWNYAKVKGLTSLLANPDVISRYYRQFAEQADTVFSDQRIAFLTQQFLSSWVPQGVIEGSSGIHRFVQERVDAILGRTDPSQSLIPVQFAVTSHELTDGMIYTQDTEIVLSGTANAITTRSIRINDVLVPPENWSQRDGLWNWDLTGLTPGLNRLLWQAYDGLLAAAGRWSANMWMYGMIPVTCTR